MANARFIYAAPGGEDVLVADDVANGANPVMIDGSPVHHEICQLNHYAIRTPEEFRCRRARGVAFNPGNSGSRKYKDSYFAQHDYREVTDTFARDRYAEAIKAGIAALPLPLRLLDEEIKRAFVDRWRELPQRSASHS